MRERKKGRNYGVGQQQGLKPQSPMRAQGRWVGGRGFGRVGLSDKLPVEVREEKGERRDIDRPCAANITNRPTRGQL